MVLFVNLITLFSHIYARVIVVQIPVRLERALIGESRDLPWENLPIKKLLDSG